MKNLLYHNLFRPLVERFGTVIATLLVAQGWNGELIEQLVAALSAVALVSFDLVVARRNREGD